MVVLKNPWLGLNPDFSSSFKNSLKIPPPSIPASSRPCALSKWTRMRFFRSGSAEKGERDSNVTISLNFCLQLTCMFLSMLFVYLKKKILVSSTVAKIYYWLEFQDIQCVGLNLHKASCCKRTQKMNEKDTGRGRKILPNIFVSPNNYLKILFI